MTELDRKALARDVLSKHTVAVAYELPGKSRFHKIICESHERLRMENETLRAELAKAKGE